MTQQLWMADVLRKAGLRVVEVEGWQTRTARDGGQPRFFEPRGLIIHETRGSATSSDAGELNVLINGREGLEGPIAHLYLSRTGTWFVVTAGASNHVKTGWGGPFSGWGNARLLGIEAQHAAGEPWTATQYWSYVAGAGAIVRHTGWQIAGHKEHQPGDKPDPIFGMDRFRADVANWIKSGGDMGWSDTDAQYAIYRLEELTHLNPTFSEKAPAELRGQPVPAVHLLLELEKTANHIAQALAMLSPEQIRAAAEAGALAGAAGAAPAMAAELLRTLTPAAIADAIGDDVAQDVVDLLGQRIGARS